jgi:alcohol dehydrogenase
VLVIGAGPIGLSAVEFAKLAGARVIVMDVAEGRLRFVREQMGIADTVPATGTEADAAAVAALTEGRMADVVIDATGSAASMARCLSFAAFGGRVVYVGITQADLVFPHAPLMHRRELTLLASRNALSGDFARIIALIEQGRIDTVPWITHRIPFADTIAAFPTLLDPSSGVIKAVVDMPG